MQSTHQEKMFSLIEGKPAELDVASYCASSSISIAAYYYWRRKYRQQTSRLAPSGFIPLQLSQAGADALASVVLPGGAVIHVYHPEVMAYLQPLV